MNKITFVKKKNATSKDDFETWEECETARCLNDFEGGSREGRPVCLVIEVNEDELWY